MTSPVECAHMAFVGRHQTHLISPFHAMIRSVRRTCTAKTIAEYLALIADVHHEFAPHPARMATSPATAMVYPRKARRQRSRRSTANCPWGWTSSGDFYLKSGERR